MTRGAGCGGWPATTPSWSQAVLDEVAGPRAADLPRGRARRSSTTCPASTTSGAGTGPWSRRPSSTSSGPARSASAGRTSAVRAPLRLPGAGPAARGGGAGARPRTRARRRGRVPRADASIAARAHGVGTEQCLRDYFRLKPEQARPALAALVEAGELLPVDDRGLEAGRPTCTATPAGRAGCTPQALLSPFDSLIWQRDRTGPSSTSTTGSRSTSRRRSGCTATTCCRSSSATRSSPACDLKADRAAGVLRVHADALGARSAGRGRPALERRLAELAGWLGLAGVA